MLKKLSDSLIKKINRNYRVIVGFNSALIALGVTGVIQPTTSALLHNTSTLVISCEFLLFLIFVSVYRLQLEGKKVLIG